MATTKVWDVDGQEWVYPTLPPVPLDQAAPPFGPVFLNGQRVTALGDPTDPQDADTLGGRVAALVAEASQRATDDALRLLKAGDTMSGDLAMSGHKVTGLADPTAAQDAATRAYVLAQITALINGAPGILDTLGEIATQLASDESAAAALATALSTETTNRTIAVAAETTARTTADTTLQGNINAEAAARAAADGTLTDAVTTETAARTAADALRLLKAGDTMTGDLAMSSHRVTGLADPTAAQDAATRAFVIAQINALIAGAPGTLDTLNEIAAQLGADENAVAALTATVATKETPAGAQAKVDAAIAAEVARADALYATKAALAVLDGGSA